MLVSFNFENEMHLQLSYRLLVERYQNADRINTPGLSLSELPSYEDHSEWLKNYSSAEYYLWEQAGELVAQVFLRSSNSEETDLAITNEMGIFVLEKHWGTGIGTDAVNALLEIHPHKTIYAKVSPENLRSENLFKKIGFQNITNIWSINHQHDKTESI